MFLKTIHFENKVETILCFRETGWQLILLSFDSFKQITSEDTFAIENAWEKKQKKREPV